jgi:hypothetical protein
MGLCHILGDLPGTKPSCGLILTMESSLCLWQSVLHWNRTQQHHLRPLRKLRHAECGTRQTILIPRPKLFRAGVSDTSRRRDIHPSTLTWVHLRLVSLDIVLLTRYNKPTSPHTSSEHTFRATQQKHLNMGTPRSPSPVPFRLVARSSC